MLTLSTLATLLVGLAIVFWAPPAKADCPHGTKLIHPHCDSAEPPPGPLVVRDSTGKLIGPVIDFVGTEIRANGDVTVAVQIEVAGTSRVFVVRVRESSFLEQHSALVTAWSLNDSCGDPLYKKLAGALSNLEGAFVEDGFAYISEADSGPVIITAESVLTGESSVCDDIEPGVLLGPVFPTVSVDLNAAFTPPFSAGF